MAQTPLTQPTHAHSDTGLDLPCCFASCQTESIGSRNANPGVRGATWGDAGEEALQEPLALQEEALHRGALPSVSEWEAVLAPVFPHPGACAMSEAMVASVAHASEERESWYVMVSAAVVDACPAPICLTGPPDPVYR